MNVRKFGVRMIRGPRKIWLIQKNTAVEGGDQNLQPREMAMGYSSEREEGEILALKGKEKMYDSDRGQTMKHEAKNVTWEKTVRKSLRVHARLQKLNI